MPAGPNAPRYHVHTGQPVAARPGYDPDAIHGLPDRAVESFARVANPFSSPDLRASESSAWDPERGSTRSSPFGLASPAGRG